MSQKLQEAIAATRAGQKREAQFLLTELLQEDPNNEYAWFLLGNLVDSPEKRMAYLGKAVAINPHNEKAKQQLTHAQRQAMAVSKAEAEPIVVMVKEDEATAVAEEPSEMPDWLTNQFDDDFAEGEPVGDEVLAERDTMLDADEEAAEEGMAAVKTAVSPPATTTESDYKQKLTLYNQLLIFLVILIIIVIIALIWSF